MASFVDFSIEQLAAELATGKYKIDDAAIQVLRG